MLYELQKRKSKINLVNIFDEEDNEDDEFDATLIKKNNADDDGNAEENVGVENESAPVDESDSNALNATQPTETTDEEVPPDWKFPGWISFICYGPFVPKHDRLTLFEINDTATEITKSRAAKRKIEKLQKDNERFGDNSNRRGVSFDQELRLKSMKLQEKRDNDRSRESIIVGLSLQESALARQIEFAERRAERLSKEGTDPLFCPYWTKVESLLKQQEDVMEKIAMLNKQSFGNDDNGNSSE